MEEKSENCKVPEDLVNGLKITEPQEADCARPAAPDPVDQHSQSKQLKDDEDQGEEECFHDCSASFEEESGAEKVQNKADEDVNSSELDEEYLLELEKNMPDEEKQKRREESTRLKEEGNEQFKKGAIQLNPSYIRAILRRAELYEKTDKLDEALEDYKTILEKDPSVHQAREACMRLPKQIEERNERLKEEMLGKLKDLGNLVLRPFGLSTENFQIKQDSSTGSYSINFVQNPNNNR
ncbi:tetratricopeptide repeat protein 1 [Octodon degus]|uniref:Tetratricopeptide repeat protein 1 n=1 Tax=Octodon degus TaxID=10160 RepID=A0A6P6E9V3_OCTDE|nr:tetratricopeptide repeat protein 1 [Octodon degus]XP_023568985.1 tetratricopeptide repeat protein 1 [Octodon degus]XP_023568986.1 tetratricopeptide repeat protein 1 [Octodon degus]